MSFNTQQPVQLAADNFQRADENPISQGGNWSANSDSGFFAPCQVLSGLAASTSTSLASEALFTGVSFPNDQYSEIRVAAGANTVVDALAICRSSSSADTWYGCGSTGVLGTVNSSLVRVYKRVAGVQTTFFAVHMTVNIGDTFRIVAVGSTVSGYMNGSLLGSFVDSSIASGTPGFQIFSVGSISSFQLSGWSGGSMVFPTIVVPDVGKGTVSLGSPLITPGWPLASIPASNPLAGSLGTSPQPNSVDQTLRDMMLLQAGETDSRVV